ncbi:signal peptidase I SipW [Jeotgalibacillus sp. R-1-5s-1]|uniref:signal peptidase I SipW n=1 Tax=Jeotgalibacillus sp. R-1-5s-1 TaxID=2555897 RepID=UPI00106C388D|nr:signal peptidase I [Jeotgalibacillus sp. R-1-5s-1]TFD97087.1 signal peptidase I [Jeotgalibacillus sp. R-1-5s-1]
MMKWIGRIFSALFYTGVLVMIAVIVFAKASGGEPELFGYQLKTVLSGSMEPGIQTGSVIAVKKAEDPMSFQPGDVITYLENENRVTTHRIVETVKSGQHVMYITKGDNNEEADSQPVLAENVLAAYTGVTVPYIGYGLNFLQTNNGALLLIIPGILLLMYSIVTVWKAISGIQVAVKKEKVS